MIMQSVFGATDMTLATGRKPRREMHARSQERPIPLDSRRDQVDPHMLPIGQHLKPDV